MRILIPLLIVLLLFLAGGTGWYFWGVNTVIVCTPFDSRVFLDEIELTPETPGRFTIEHLSRNPHMLKVQRSGYSESYLSLDFPLTSSCEFVNIRLTPLPKGRTF